MPPTKIMLFLRAPRTLQGRLSVSIESKLPIFFIKTFLIKHFDYSFLLMVRKRVVHLTSRPLLVLIRCQEITPWPQR